VDIATLRIVILYRYMKEMAFRHWFASSAAMKSIDLTSLRWSVKLLMPHWSSTIENPLWTQKMKL